MISRMSQSSAPNSLRRFFDRTETLYPAGARPDQRLESVAELLLEIQRAWDMDSPHFNPLRERVEHLSVTGYYIREGRRPCRFEGYASALTYMRKVYFRPEHGTPDLPFFRRLVTEW